jgi:hypothetical protein
MINTAIRALNKMSNAQKTAFVIAVLASAMVILTALIAPPTSTQTGMEVSFIKAVGVYGFIVTMIMMPMVIVIKQTESL